jgi:cell fate regulator YaaT (PSP1 superfamily)
MNNHFDEVKWASLSFYEQMGNIGSEVGRTMNAIRQGDEQSLQGAYYRGLDLIDATAKNLSNSRRKELLRARELFSVAAESKTVDQKLDNYFMVFAVLARS